MQPFDTIGSYSPSAVETLIARIGDARLALYLEKTPLPYDVFFDAMPETHRTFFHQLADYHETPDCICVRGGVELDSVPLAEQSAHYLRWGSSGFPERYNGAKIVVYGHWNNGTLESGWPLPRILKSSIGIDTITFGVLTAVRLPDGAIFQSARSENTGGLGLDLDDREGGPMFVRIESAIHVVQARAKNGAAILALLAAACCVSCGPKTMAAAAPANPPANAHIYTCDDASPLAVEYINGEARATFQGKTTPLPQVQSADGARYEKDGVSVWNKGRDVTFAQGGTTRHCTESNPDDRAH